MSLIVGQTKIKEIYLKSTKVGNGFIGTTQILYSSQSSGSEPGGGNEPAIDPSLPMYRIRNSVGFDVLLKSTT